MTGKPETDASGEPLYNLLYRLLSSSCSGFLRATIRPVREPRLALRHEHPWGIMIRFLPASRRWTPGCNQQDPQNICEWHPPDACQ